MEGTIDTSTPVTTTDAAPVAPTTSAPAESSATSQRPSSFKEALEQAAALNTPPATAEDGATTPPVADPTLEGAVVHPGTEKKGPIPFDVHSKALENARAKAAAEAQATFDRDYGWARQVSPQQISQFAGLAQRMSTDPIGFVREFVAELQNHPTYGQQLRSEAARTLAGGRGATNLEPDVAIQDANGQIVGKTYSDGRVRAIVTQAVNDALGREVAPLKQAHEQAQAVAYANQQRAEVEAKADTLLERAGAWEGFTEHQADIAQVLEAHPDYTLQDAYLDVFARTIRPTLDQKAERTVLDNLKKKAGGSTAGAGGSTAPLTRPTSVGQLAALMRQLDGAA